MIEMPEAGIGISHAGFRTQRGHNVVDQPRGHGTGAVTEKDGSSFPAADEEEHVTEVFVIEDGNDPRFPAFPLTNRDSFTFHIEIPVHR